MVALTERADAAAPSNLNLAFRDGVCRLLSPDRGRGCVFVSSEPLSDDPGWDMMPRISLVLIGKDGTVTSRPLKVAAL